MRLYNERLVLSLVRRYGSLPKADIARLTGLSATTAMTIVRRLEADRLLLKNAPQRGRVGQPSVPLSLNPNGAFSLGAKVGRRSADLVLIDFVGGVRHELHERYAYPVPAAIVEFISAGSRALARRLAADERSRIAGLGIASPFELWNWEEEVGSPPGVMEAWRGFDLARRSRQGVRRSLFTCATMRARPVPPSCSSAMPPTIMTCSTSSSPGSSAAAWCSMAASSSADPDMPAPSGRC